MRSSERRSARSSRGFNPRAREGRDRLLMIWTVASADGVSIHAPARGATYALGCVMLTCSNSFNPRAREGRDSLVSLFVVSFRTFLFQSTRPRGARRGSYFRSGTNTKFQSTRPRGARPIRVARLNLTKSGFNPRAREGRD